MNLKKIENEFFKHFKMVLGVGEAKAKSLSAVAMDVLKQQAEAHSKKKKSPPKDGWIDVDKKLPTAFQTVWLTNGKGWVSLGCLVEDQEGWHWAESNGVVYQEDGEIVSECESEDLDVKFWHELPKVKFI